MSEILTELDTRDVSRAVSHDVSHDGVKPMQACCVKCGYRFGGVPIKGGILTCPECGEENAFYFEPINKSSMVWLSVMRITLLVLFGLAILAGLLWMTGAAALLQKAKGP